jgi:acyl-CoA synthetase (AMP-forming)/AMP-acid ligase II
MADVEDLSFWHVFEAVSGVVPEREYLVAPTARRTYREVRERALRLASFLSDRGVGCQVPRARLASHESGQDHVGIYMGNRAEYVESLFGIVAARAAPANVNHRYVAAELEQLVRECGLTGLVYEAESAPAVADVAARVGSFKVLIEVGGEGSPAVAGAFSYEEIAGSGAVRPLPDTPLGEDLCVICTGGTTGLPKGVLWRQCDLLAQLIGDRHLVTGAAVDQLSDLANNLADTPVVALIASPLMHFAGVGTAMLLASAGATIVLADPPRGFNAASALLAIESERVQTMSIVGDAFAKPLLAELGGKTYDTSSLRLIQSGGSVLSARVKRDLKEALGGKVVVSEGLGSSEAGLQARSYSSEDADAGVFIPDSTTRIVSEDRSRELQPTENIIGWLATAGRVPLGYLGQLDLTSRTFPSIEGRRYSIPGDLARWRPDGRVQLLGRAATTINSGGEKIYADEVEHALRQHSGVSEVVVVGRPSERWGSEVVALVVPGEAFDLDAMMACAGTLLARYKLPKDVIVVESIGRTPVGKVDYSWARSTAVASRVVGA